MYHTRIKLVSSFPTSHSMSIVFFLATEIETLFHNRNFKRCRICLFQQMWVRIYYFKLKLELLTKLNTKYVTMVSDDKFLKLENSSISNFIWGMQTFKWFVFVCAKKIIQSIRAAYVQLIFYFIFY